MMKSIKSIFIACVFILPFTLHAQDITRAELAQALLECEQDLNASQQQIEILRSALQSTNQMIDQRKAISDSLIINLRQQLFLQDSVTTLLKINADTFQRMVVDYSEKLDEVNKLYIHELKKQARPWFLSANGLKGLSYGAFIGAALGLTFSLAR